jgi:NADH-quinone oxidoreductase subunit G
MLGGGVDLLWLLGADEFDMGRIGASTFVVYQGHHGDSGAARADVILPGAAYTEKTGTYANTEGRAQRAFAATLPPGEAREDWRILRAASAVLGTALPYDTIDALRARMESVAPALGKIGYLPRFGCADAAGPAGDPDAVADSPIGAAFAEYHRTDAISRASPTMAACVAALSAPSAPPALAAE